MLPSGDSQTVGQLSGEQPTTPSANVYGSFSGSSILLARCDPRDLLVAKMLSRVGEVDNLGDFKSFVLQMSLSLLACFYFNLWMIPLWP